MSSLSQINAAQPARSQVVSPFVAPRSETAAETGSVPGDAVALAGGAPAAAAPPSSHEVAARSPFARFVTFGMLGLASLGAVMAVPATASAQQFRGNFSHGQMVQGGGFQNHGFQNHGFQTAPPRIQQPQIQPNWNNRVQQQTQWNRTAPPPPAVQQWNRTAPPPAVQQWNRGVQQQQWNQRVGQVPAGPVQTGQWNQGAGRMHVPAAPPWNGGAGQVRVPEGQWRGGAVYGGNQRFDIPRGGWVTQAHGYYPEMRTFVIHERPLIINRPVVVGSFFNDCYGPGWYGHGYHPFGFYQGANFWLGLELGTLIGAEYNPYVQPAYVYSPISQAQIGVLQPPAGQSTFQTERDVQMSVLTAMSHPTQEDPSAGLYNVGQDGQTAGPRITTAYAYNQLRQGQPIFFHPSNGAYEKISNLDELQSYVYAREAQSDAPAQQSMEMPQQ